MARVPRYNFDQMRERSKLPRDRYINLIDHVSNDLVYLPDNSPGIIGPRGHANTAAFASWLAGYLDGGIGEMFWGNGKSELNIVNDRDEILHFFQVFTALKASIERKRRTRVRNIAAMKAATAQSTVSGSRYPHLENEATGSHQYGEPSGGEGIPVPGLQDLVKEVGEPFGDGDIPIPDLEDLIREVTGMDQSIESVDSNAFIGKWIERFKANDTDDYQDGGSMAQDISPVHPPQGPEEAAAGDHQECELVIQGGSLTQSLQVHVKGISRASQTPGPQDADASTIRPLEFFEAGASGSKILEPDTSGSQTLHTAAEANIPAPSLEDLVKNVAITSQDLASSGGNTLMAIFKRFQNQETIAAKNRTPPMLEDTSPNLPLQPSTNIFTTYFRYKPTPLQVPTLLSISFNQFLNLACDVWGLEKHYMLENGVVEMNTLAKGTNEKVFYAGSCDEKVWRNFMKMIGDMPESEVEISLSGPANV